LTIFPKQIVGKFSNYKNIKIKIYLKNTQLTIAIRLITGRKLVLYNSVQFSSDIKKKEKPWTYFGKTSRTGPAEKQKEKGKICDKGWKTVKNIHGISMGKFT
jgi:hypothetical protein